MGEIREEKGICVHYVGAGGSGVSALAQFRLMAGGRATGSDRSFDRGDAGEARRKLEALGLKVFSQDGSALIGRGARPSYLVASGAVEDDIPDLAKARELKIPIRHRADELSRHVESMRSVAIAGTSGKSTVAGMLFEILEFAGLDPSIIAGGELRSLKKRGLIGNAWRGRSRWLVVEADESDATLTRYRPEIGVLLNISKDHKEIPDLESMFSRFKAQAGSFVSAARPELEKFNDGASTFGFEGGTIRGEGLAVSADSSAFSVRGIRFSIPMPGRHNAENALAAAAAAASCGVSLENSSAALKAFSGIARRFESAGRAGGIEVVDDFAHNPAKVEATISAARPRAKRILAVFQLHGFAPARLMKAEFVEALARSLSPDDRLWMPPIYYVGGTADKDVSAEDYVRELAARGLRAEFAGRRADILDAVSREARPGDLVLVMGARDPSLPDFTREILARLGGLSGRGAA